MARKRRHNKTVIAMKEKSYGPYLRYPQAMIHRLDQTDMMRQPGHHREATFGLCYLKSTHTSTDILKRTRNDELERAPC
jgi:hypothetical protein